MSSLWKYVSKLVPNHNLCVVVQHFQKEHEELHQIEASVATALGVKPGAALIGTKLQLSCSLFPKLQPA